MREILFRGKLISKDVWCYGNLRVTKNGHSIITPDDTPLGTYGSVEPTTVGQYTGLKDKNGNMIFENDIYTQGDKNILYIVEYTKDCSFMGKQISSHSWAGLAYWRDRIEVIGNKFDNPELIKGNE